MTLQLTPLTQRAAKSFVSLHHRHNLPPQGDLFRVGAGTSWDTPSRRRDQVDLFGEQRRPVESKHRWMRQF